MPSLAVTKLHQKYGATTMNREEKLSLGETREEQRLPWIGEGLQQQRGRRHTREGEGQQQGGTTTPGNEKGLQQQEGVATPGKEKGCSSMI